MLLVASLYVLQVSFCHWDDRIILPSNVCKSSSSSTVYFSPPPPFSDETLLSSRWSLWSLVEAVWTRLDIPLCLFWSWGNFLLPWHHMSPAYHMEIIFRCQLHQIKKKKSAFSKFWDQKDLLILRPTAIDLHTSTYRYWLSLYLANICAGVTLFYAKLYIHFIYFFLANMKIILKT